MSDLRRRLGTGPDARAFVSVVDLTGTAVAKVTFRTEVALDDVDDRRGGPSPTSMFPPW